MPDLLLELFSEEIPARMQAQAAADLKRLVTDGLVAAGLTYEGGKAFATPRRLALTIHGVTTHSAELREERKGPRVGAPAAAIEGFLKSAGISSIDQAEIRSDPKKGDFYVATVTKAGRSAVTILTELVPTLIRDFPWPKSMRWGARSAPADFRFGAGEGGGSLRWVRPLRSVLCTFGPETEEPAVIEFEIGGVQSGNFTFGHRFMSSAEPIRIRRFEDYLSELEAAKVVLDADRRKAIIETEAKNLAFAQGLELVEDQGLLEEVAGLVEWPVVLMGTFDPDFLAIPDEVIRLTIRNNQKCFVLSDPKTGALTNRFILVANIAASDGGKAIAAGNERVIAARLSDARFFWDQDRKLPLEAHGSKLAPITFHEKLGTQAERVERIARLSRELARLTGADPDSAERAARLAKTDLVTGMVGEFPELQGVMGRYYALAEGENAAIADAIRDHYRPQGPKDAVPAAPVSAAVALADKLDILTGFWTIDEKPTGSKDPFALRRAALGIIRIVLHNGIRLPLEARLQSEISRLSQTIRTEAALDQAMDVAVATRGLDLSESSDEEIALKVDQFAASRQTDADSVAADLLAFFADRLKVHLREEGARHDLIDAVFTLPGQDDLLLIVRRVEALAAFLASEDGANLLTGYRRAANILRAEERKDGAGAFNSPPDAALIEAQGAPEERVLHSIMKAAEAHARQHIAAEDFEGAMRALAELRPAVDAFFDKVTVNAEDPALRSNRLRLLNRLRQATMTVADFSKIGG